MSRSAYGTSRSTSMVYVSPTSAACRLTLPTGRVSCGFSGLTECDDASSDARTAQASLIP